MGTRSVREGTRSKNAESPNFELGGFSAAGLMEAVWCYLRSCFFKPAAQSLLQSCIHCVDLDSCMKTTVGVCLRGSSSPPLVMSFRSRFDEKRFSWLRGGSSCRGFSVDERIEIRGSSS
jgi:hypothetical protein